MRSMVWWFVLCVIFVYLVDLFTFKPHVISGNGNLGLLFGWPALIISIFFAKSLWNGLRNLRLKSSSSIMIGLGAFALFIIFLILEYKFAANLINDLGGSPKEPSSKIYRFPWLNQYTNTIFINFYTLGMLVAGISFLNILFKRIKGK
ncbi:hypothetical protein M3172_19375 [Mesobacillus subterraneus]|uniref:hypothetical protein n=1 Tax=Mesobacillus subterraneus TaxID=285983 RepID=UPI00203F6B63|nr:hypothetical protein [Mesobacillus subterraneus]MCM3575365.1 hypothetical protein [Mesobacillus subterraneus]